MGFGKDGKGVIIRERDTITLGALATITAIKSGSQINPTDDFRLIKTEYFIGVEGMTSGEGPVLIGLADNELSVTEIAGSIGADGPVDRNDRGGEEAATRAVWVLDAIFSQVFPGGSSSTKGEKTFRWTFSNPEGWTFFAFNNDPNTLTTGTIVHFYAVHYGVWVT